MRTVFFAFALFFAGSCPALGSPLDFSYTHNTALTVPELSEPEASFHLAKTWFLPDWQAGLGSRTDTAPAGSGDLNGSDYTCEKTYNLNTSCTSPQIIEKTHNMGKITCYKCKCPDNYKTTSCKTGWHLSGMPCKIGTTSYYTGCAVDACPSGYTAGKTCGSGYTLEKSGQSGDQYCGKCVTKSCPSGYTAGLANCNGKTYPAGWTYSSNGYSGDSICGKCTPKTCSSGTAGLANCNGKAQPSGWTYSSNGYAGDSVCGTCTAKSCPAGYTAGVTQCSNTTSWTYGSNGYAGDSICGKCTEKGCADGYTKGLSDCNGKTHPAGWSYTSGTPSGSTVCGKCTAKTCSAGSTSCDTATQNATANGYYAGDTPCYTCTAKTCEQLGKKTCNGSCIATSECCGGCGNNQKCENGNCVQDKTPLQICQDKILEKDPKAAFVSTAGELVDAISAAKNAYLMKDIKGSTISFTKTMAVRDLTYYADSISECSGQPTRNLSMTSPVVSSAVDFDVATIISGTMSIGARTTFSKLVEATAITTTNKGASLYIRECDSSIGQYTNKYNNNILELVGSNPKDCHINIEYITIASNGVITLSVINCTLENNGGLIDNSIYANAVSVYLDYAVWQVDNRSYGSICFSYAKPSWTIDMRQSCIKASNANIFNCASSAYLQTLQYQDDQYWNGECQQYCMGGGGYEDPCISGTRYVDTYTSYPY